MEIYFSVPISSYRKIIKQSIVFGIRENHVKSEADFSPPIFKNTTTDLYLLKTDQYVNSQVLSPHFIFPKTTPNNLEKAILVSETNLFKMYF